MTRYSREWKIEPLPKRKGAIELTTRGLVCAITGKPVRIENGEIVEIESGKCEIERIAA